MIIILILLIIYLAYLVHSFKMESDRVKQKNESISNGNDTHIDLKGNLYLNENDHKVNHEYLTNGDYVLKDRTNNNVIKNYSSEERMNNFKNIEEQIYNHKKTGSEDSLVYSGVDDISALFNHIDNGNPLHPNNKLSASKKIYVVFGWNNNYCYKENILIQLENGYYNKHKSKKSKYQSGINLNLFYYRRVITGEIKPIHDKSNSIYSNFVNKVTDIYCKKFEEYIKPKYVSLDKYSKYSMKELNDYYLSILYLTNDFLKTKTYNDFKYKVIEIYQKIIIPLMNTNRFLKNKKQKSNPDDYFYDIDLKQRENAKAKMKALMKEMERELDSLND